MAKCKALTRSAVKGLTQGLHLRLLVLVLVGPLSSFSGQFSVSVWINRGHVLHRKLLALTIVVLAGPPSSYLQTIQYFRLQFVSLYRVCSKTFSFVL